MVAAWRCRSESARIGLNSDRIQFQPGPDVNLSTRVRSLSDFKANAAEILLDLEKRGEPLVITQNGQAKAILQDLGAYEKTQESLALLKILALGSRQVEAGATLPLAGVAARVKAKRAAA